jgi:hypothetical protein
VVKEHAASSGRIKMDSESPIGRMVREAIETVATPEVRLQILHRALHMAREHEIPKAGAALHRFVDKHLRTAMAFYIGSEATEAVMQNLEPMVTYAERLSSKPPTRSSRLDETRKLGRHRQNSGVEPRMPALDALLDTSKYPTVTPTGSALPMVFVATRSSQRFQAILQSVGEAAAVQQIEDVVAFLDNLKATASLGPLVVIDCVEASVQPGTIATFAHELPTGSAVLLWGADHRHKQLTELATGREGWLQCDVEAAPEDVASLIHMLLGE